MKLNQLEALIAIADGIGIAGAAKRLHITQPAVTKSLANLEYDLGVELLDRTEYRLKLTPYGNMLLGHARAIKSELEKAKRDIELLKNRRQVYFRYNGSPGTLPKLVPQALQRARKSFPTLTLDIVGALLAPKKKSFEDLAAGVFDLLICSIVAEDNTEGFICEPLVDVDFLVIAAPDHPATKMSNPTLKKLRDFEWLAPTKEGLPYKLIRRAFREADSEMPDNLIALPHMEMLASFVRNGEHLAFVPYHPSMIDGDYDEFCILDVCPSKIGWTLHTLQRDTGKPSIAINAFIEAAKSYVEESEEKRRLQVSSKMASSGVQNQNL